MLLSCLRLYYPKKKKKRKFINNTHTGRTIFHSFIPPQNKKIKKITEWPFWRNFLGSTPEYMFLTGSTFSGRTLLCCLSFCLFHFAHSAQESMVWWSCISISMGTTMEWRGQKIFQIGRFPDPTFGCFLEMFLFFNKTI